MDCAEGLLRATSGWGVYLASSERDGDEIMKAAPLLDGPSLMHLMFNGSVLIVMDAEAQAREFYESVVGDDGPTQSNPYDGPARVFAILGGPDGWLTENT